MKVTWKELSFLPSEEALATLNQAWSWLLPETYQPVMASALGDLFFQKDSAVYWLDTGAGEIRRVAESRAEFLELLKTDKANEWFMPPVIERLLAAGKTLKPDHCYTYAILPIFKEGSYEVTNLNPVPAKEHFALTGDLHRQLKDLPEGSKVKLEITE